MIIKKINRKIILSYITVLLLPCMIIASSIDAYAIDKDSKLDVPQNLVVKQTGEKGLELTWKKSNGAKGYEVYKALPNLGGYKKVKTVKASGKLFYRDKNVKLGRSGTYKVRAYRYKKGKKEYSKYTYPVSAKVCKKTDKKQNAAKPELILDADTDALILGIGEPLNNDYEQFFTNAVGPKKKNGKERYKPLNTRLRWYSTNPSIIKVKSGTNIKARNKPGKAYIYVIAHNGKKSKKIPVIIKDYAYENVNIKYAPGEIQVLFNLCEKQIRDICSYYTKHKKYTFDQYYIIGYDGEKYWERGTAPLYDKKKLPVIKDILEKSPFEATEIEVGAGSVEITIYKSDVGEDHLIFAFDREKELENSNDEISPHWYYNSFTYE